jgi:hypothetical protein
MCEKIQQLFNISLFSGNKIIRTYRTPEPGQVQYIITVDNAA